VRGGYCGFGKKVTETWGVELTVAIQEVWPFILITAIA